MKRVKSNFQVLLAEKRQRENRRLSLRQVAEESGVKEYTVYGFANNTLKEYPADAIARLCVYFGCSVGELLTLKDVGQPMFIQGGPSMVGLSDQQQVQMKRMAEEFLQPFHGDAVTALGIETTPVYVLGKEQEFYDVVLQLPAKSNPHRLRFAVRPNNEATIVHKDERVGLNVKLNRAIQSLEPNLRDLVLQGANSYAATVGLTPVEQIELQNVATQLGSTSYRILMLADNKRFTINVLIPNDANLQKTFNVGLELVSIE